MLVDPVQMIRLGLSKILLFILRIILFKCKQRWCESFASPLLVLNLFITHPWFFFILPEVVGKLFKFIFHVP